MNYKIGDLVTITGNNNWHCFPIGKTVRLVEKRWDGGGWRAEYLDGHDYWYVRERDIKPAKPQKIVITTDGKTTLARAFYGNTEAKRAEAKCAPSDTFDFNVGADLAFERLMAVKQDKIKHIAFEDAGIEDTKPEPIKLYCVKSFEPGTWLTKGKIYEADSQFNVKYDDGYVTAEGYSSIEDFHKRCALTGTPLWPLARRPAKAGEWVMPICDSKFGRYKKNQPLKVIDDLLNVSQNVWCNVGVIYAHPDCSHYVIKNDEYLVLDGYKGESNDDM